MRSTRLDSLDRDVQITVPFVQEHRVSPEGGLQCVHGCLWRGWMDGGNVVVVEHIVQLGWDGQLACLRDTIRKDCGRIYYHVERDLYQDIFISQLKNHRIQWND